MTLDELAQRIVTTQEEMAVKANYALPDDYDFLVQREPPQPITKADRIRAMSDEELAETFDLLTRTKPDTKDDKQCWLDWLKQEAE